MLSSTGMAQARAREDGTLSVVVFDGPTGLPRLGVRLRCDEGEPGGVSDREGFVQMGLPEGRHVLDVRVETGWVQVTAFDIVEGQSTEILLRVFADHARASVEAPALARAGSMVAPAPVAKRGRLAGVVRDVDTQKALLGAQVLLRGQTAAARTGADGRFVVTVPSGTYDVTVLHARYMSTTVPQVVVVEGEGVDLEIDLIPDRTEVRELLISTPYVAGSTSEQLATRREASAVTDVLGSAEMRRNGDGNAAMALRRVPGITLVDGKYVYVRGLGQRYATTLFDGVVLPGLEPEVRVVPLDIFPTGVLQGITVQKTYTPDMPGTFAGGVVQLKSRGAPEAFAASVTAQSGWVEGTTLGHGLGYAGGPTDWLGYNGGFRDLPRSVQEASDAAPLVEADRFSSKGYDAQQLERFGELMPNVWSTQPTFAPPGMGLSGSLGDAGVVWGKKVGAMVSGSFSNAWKAYARHEQVVSEASAAGAEIGDVYDFIYQTNTIQSSLALTTGIDWSAAHKVHATAMMVRVTDNEAREHQGFNRDASRYIRVTRLRWIERMLQFYQLRGEHAFSAAAGLVLAWHYTLSRADRDEPDRREIRYDHESDDLWLLSDRPEGNLRFFSYLDHTNHNVGLDLTLPMRRVVAKGSVLKWGGNVTVAGRQVDTRRYKYMHKGGVSAAIAALKPEDVFSKANIDPKIFQFEEFTQATDNYFANQQVYAGYGMLDANLGNGLRFVAGVRVEAAHHFVETYELFVADKTPTVAEQTAVDVLPALNVRWDLGGGGILRVSGSRTVSRPDFRELSTATFQDVAGTRMTLGNPDLTRTRIASLDARWEWYGRGIDSASVAVFYQRFDDPIEPRLLPSAQISVQPSNTDLAQNGGLEVEMRKSLGIVHRQLADAYLQANVTFVRSRVDLPQSAQTVETSSERPLAGQSPYMFNLQMGYDGLDNGFVATCVYNVFGPQLSVVGAYGIPDTYILPFHALDIVLGKSLGGGWKATLAARNVLRWHRRAQQGNIVVSDAVEPLQIGAKLSYRL